MAAGETSLTDSTCEHVTLVLREGDSLLWNDPRTEPLRPDDRLVEIMAVPGPARADQPAPRT